MRVPIDRSGRLRGDRDRSRSSRVESARGGGSAVAGWRIDRHDHARMFVGVQPPVGGSSVVMSIVGLGAAVTMRVRRAMAMWLGRPRAHAVMEHVTAQVSCRADDCRGQQRYDLRGTREGLQAASVT